MNLRISDSCFMENHEQFYHPFNAGQVFTPQSLADWVAKSLFRFLRNSEAPVIFDPACGEGDLLNAVKSLNKEATVYGADIDRRAVNVASKSISKRNLFVAKDSLAIKSANGTGIKMASAPFRKKIDGIIANPPWGADLVHTRKEMTLAGYTLATGQFDTWELFVELSLHLLKPDGVAAFIIPDSVFLPEHQKTREYLQRNASILLIARLGEGFFENVYRGTTVIVFRKSKPKATHRIEVVRLDSVWRKHILAGASTIDEAMTELGHKVLQRRFCNDVYARWDIDVRDSEKRVIRAIAEHEGEWTKWLSTGRGVEMSKRGQVVVCPLCGTSHSISRSKTIHTCPACEHSGRLNKFKIRQIIEPLSSMKRGWMPLIVGEDVDRYYASPNRAIKLNLRGINYKDLQTYSKRRLLVRKTGVGLKAAITADDVMTNQVVFHYYENENNPPPRFYLSYVLGVLNSRVMFAYHLRLNGESEWRSHPYITQEIIKRLPVPIPAQGKQSWKQARAIAREVDSVLQMGVLSREKDIKIESLVAGMYGLTRKDMSWVDNVISSAQNLEPMRVLKSVDIKKITPVSL